MALLNNVSIYADEVFHNIFISPLIDSIIWVTHLIFVDIFIFCTPQIHTVLLQKKKKSNKGVTRGENRNGLVVLNS